YERAIAWYELIFKLLIPKCDTEMHLYELGGFIPCVDLCYCYFKLGKFREAVEYNERAAAFKPDSPIIEYDRRKFREAGII
ncbi:MAG: glycosyl transferase, partial [Bacillota bacterium]|nr:glycosyl transferase [Bacillota bacterium]